MSSLRSLNGERRGKDIFISYGREEGVKVGLREEHIVCKFNITDCQTDGDHTSSVSLL